MRQQAPSVPQNDAANVSPALFNLYICKCG